MPLSSYFDAIEYSKWNITNYLDHRIPDSTKAPDESSFAESTDLWVKSLTDYANDANDLKRAGYALCLLARYREEGMNSDKAIAKRWRQYKTPPEHRSAVQKPKRNTKRPPKPYMLDRNILTPPQIPSSIAGADQEDAGTEYSFTPTETSTTTQTTTTTLDFDVPAPSDLAQQFQEMQEKIPCGNSTLESSVYGLITLTDNKPSCLVPLDLWIIDSKVEKRLGELERVVVKNHIQPLPEFPRNLDSYLEKYHTVRTHEDCLDISQATSELFTTRTDRDKVWIDQIMYHSLDLLLTGYLSLPLGEGSWDSAFHPTFWHNPLFYTPLYSQQKELKMGGKDKTVEKLRWDGVIYSQKPLGGYQSLAFGLFEVSKPHGVDSDKWRNDWSKLVHGCRAMLSNLKDAVDNHPDTVAKLAVVGVLQSGVRAQLIIMSCIGRNLYYMQESRPQEFPLILNDMPNVVDYIRPIWKSRQVMLACHHAVREYFESKEYPL